ncbi:MAG: DUF378 domain-containing protein [Candidatus Wildermuthbacteria bacterium]|nr:DUF378 domain-containing protein [Candidatus Wildermuthbacteria bacterium]
MKMLELVALILVLIGGLNWGLVGLLNLDIVATIFGGEESIVARVVYVLVGLSALYMAVTILPKKFAK